MKLQDNEIRDIIKYLEAGKPLPEQYRFLLFEDKREVELVWNGKTNEVCNVVLPFQTIEHVDEPRTETGPHKKDLQFGLFDERGRQLKGWTNKLIWGDNKLILSSLKNGPLRKEIEDQGGIKLIYIDPPFDVGADFSINIEIGDEQFTKEPSVLEELAYRDTWGKGTDSFIAMIYERLSLMRDLLADTGSVFIHCDWRVNSHIKLVMDEIFGKEYFRATICWKKATKTTSFNDFGSEHDSIIIFCKSYESYIFNQQFRDLADEQVDKNYKFVQTANGEIVKLTKKQIEGIDSMPSGRRFRAIPITNMNKNRPNLRFEFLGHVQTWAKSKDKLLEDYNNGLIFQTSSGTIPVKKQFLDENKGVKVNDLWVDISPVQGGADENTNYPTQKPEKLLERIIQSSTNEGDLVADFFCGSGTTPAVAEKLGRKWIGSDLGKFAVHTARKRMIGVQRQLKDDGKNYRAFEILNLGKYERQYYVGTNQNLRDEEKKKQQAQREKEFVELILHAYRAEAVSGFKTFSGKKSSRLVAIGPINLPVTRDFVNEVIKECVEKQITKADILAFEFEMNLSPNVQEDAKEKGIDLVLKHIPKEVFDKRAVDFDFESKKEFVRTQNDKGEWEEKWTGDYIFENEWQSFRTKKDRSLELKSVYFEYPQKGRHKIAVKVVDIFGNDTMKVIEVGV